MVCSHFILSTCIRLHLHALSLERRSLVLQTILEALSCVLMGAVAVFVGYGAASLCTSIMSSTDLKVGRMSRAIFSLYAWAVIVKSTQTNDGSSDSV